MAQRQFVLPWLLQCSIIIASWVIPSTLGQASLQDNAAYFVQVGLLVLLPGAFLHAYWCASMFKRRKPPLWLAAVRAAVGFAAGIVLFHAGAVLFGAPVLQLVDRTLLWAALQATLAAMPLAVLFGSDWASYHRAVVHIGPLQAPELPIVCGAIGSIVGSWLGAIPIPLDWDRPWQVWPVSCVIGCLAGYSLGICVGFISVLSGRLGAHPHRT